MTLESIPKGLQEIPRWLFANCDKAPSNVSGIPVDGTDPHNWISFDKVVVHLNSPQFNRDRLLPFPGFEFMAIDPYTFIDLDVYKIPEQAKITEWVKHLSTYTERSMSGGLHLIIQTEGLTNSRHDWFEIYTDRRFSILTGKVIIDRPIRVVPCQLIHDAIADFFPPPNVPVPTLMNKSFFNQVMLNIRSYRDHQKFLDVFNGSLKYHNDDPSRADLYICCVVARFTDDEVRIEQCWRASPLSHRPKFDTRPDYVRRTIRRALELKRGSR